MSTRYFISLPEPEKARTDEAWSFRSQSPEGFAEELQAALRSDVVFAQWLASQSDPDSVDPELARNDPSATVIGKLDDLHVDLEIVTTLPSEVLKHRLRLLAGHHWQLRDVRAA